MISPIEISPSSTPGQIKVVRVTQNARKQLVFNLTDDSGKSVDLKAEVQNPPAALPNWSPQRDATGFNVKVRFRIGQLNTNSGRGIPSDLSLAALNPNIIQQREALMGTFKLDIGGEILDQKEHRGFVSFQLENSDTPKAGIFEGFIERYVENGDVGWTVDTWPVLLAIEPPAMQLLDNNGSGPLLIPEVRLALLDVDNQSDGAPFSNLLDDTEFTDLDIVYAQRRVVQLWNETPPPVCQFSTQNFPYRYWWLEGTCGHLLKMSAARYRRNRLAYQAGGIAIDDQSKADEYETVGQRKLDSFMGWMQTEKYRINMERTWSPFI